MIQIHPGVSVRGGRRGFAMAAVLLYAMAVVTLAAGLIRVSTARQRAFRVDQQTVQADFLLSAGVSRAQSAWLRSGDYRGESWRCDVAGSEGQVKYGQVVISVTSVAPVGGSGEAKAGESGEWEISVVAEYPAESAQRVRRHRTWRVPAADSAAAGAAGASAGQPGSANGVAVDEPVSESANESVSERASATE